MTQPNSYFHTLDPNNFKESRILVAIDQEGLEQLHLRFALSLLILERDPYGL